ncbi:MAG: FAD-dependent oxidoreductase [Kiloniellaceae bacterium]
MPLSIAIIGAGPSGFYTAAALVKSGLDCRIDILESLPTPYGLIRGGVAPDHQSTKGVSRSFGRTALEPQVGYYGNVELGRNLSVAELGQIYDAVVLAIGAPVDRSLDIPGGDKHGAYGAAAFVGWYNGHPDFCDLDPDLRTPSVCVIGNGNVAVDVARVLVKTPAEMATSDLPDYAAKAIHGAPITDVYLIGRRGPAEAKFTNKELSELGELEECVPLVDLAQLPEAICGEMSDRDRRLKEKNLATLRAFARRRPEEKRKRLHFVFYAKPVEVLGGDRVEGLRLERTRVEAGRAVGTGETFDIPCGLVVSAIGYRMHPLQGVPVDERTGVVRNRDGRVAEGLYVVGWAKRGPTGVIGTNKSDGDVVAAQIRADIPEGRKPGRPALERLLRERAVRWVSFAEWQRIEAAEVAAAPPGAPRRKLIRINDMLAVLGENALSSQRCERT